MNPKKILFIVAMIFIVVNAFTQQLFSVKQNSLSKEIVTQLNTNAKLLEADALSLTKNNENKDVYPIALSSAEDTKIIIMSEVTGTHVEIIPLGTNEFQLTPFFIEELKRGVLGDAEKFLVIETASGNSIKKIHTVSASNGDVYIPRYFYGERDNVREALPVDRRILGIFKAKPRLISAFPDNPDVQRYIAQLEEEQSYYVYMFKLPDGTLCTYDEHFKSDRNANMSSAEGPLQFNLVGQMTATERAATEFALQLWSNKLAGKVPIDIQVDLKPKDPTVLGSSYYQPQFGSNQTQTYYSSSLWNQLVGYDATTSRDIRIEMNSIFSWYYGTDGNPPYNKYDYISTILHEVNHGLGFADNIDDKTGKFLILHWEDEKWYYVSWPGAFDRQLFQGTSGTNIPDLTEAQRKAVVISNNLYAGRPGSKLLAANGGTRVKMYAPYIYNSGSSVSHWDESVTFKTFMKYSNVPGTSGVCHTINAYEIGMLVDMGWTENSSTGDCPGVTNMKVSYSADCNSAQISWNEPSRGNECQVRFEKEKAYQHATKMAVWDTNNNSLASHDFGTNAGTSSYYTITSGSHLPVFYSSDGKWHYCLNNSPYTFNFQKEHKYTVVCSDDGTYLVFHVKDDGGGSIFKFNIYRDGNLVKANHDQITYHDSGFNPNTSHTWTVKVACASGGESAPANVTKSCTVGIEENSSQTITVYPNPTSGVFKVQEFKSSRVQNVEIYDVVGRKVPLRHSERSEESRTIRIAAGRGSEKGWQPQADGVVIDLTAHPAGIYFLKIQTETGTVTKKIIKY